MCVCDRANRVDRRTGVGRAGVQSESGMCMLKHNRTFIVLQYGIISELLDSKRIDDIPVAQFATIIPPMGSWLALVFLSVS